MGKKVLKKKSSLKKKKKKNNDDHEIDDHTPPPEPEEAKVENVNVVVRIRPTRDAKEESEEEPSSDESDGERNALAKHWGYKLKKKGGIEVKMVRSGRKVTKQFSVNTVFDQPTSQLDMYKKTAAGMIRSYVQGYHATIFAYGQTGSGKTYTMFGKEGPGQMTSEERGVIPRAANDIFVELQRDPLIEQANIAVTLLEIYNEEFNDLLNIKEKKKLKLREDDGQVRVENLKKHYVQSPKELCKTISKGLQNRHVGATQMNSVSSRSHTVCTIYLKCRLKNGYTRESNFHLVDLAGCERVKKSKATGEMLKQAQMINKSLSALGLLIRALTEKKRSHMPFRDSKLTYYLKNSLGANSKTALITAVSPEPRHASETVSSLEFAQRAQQVEGRVMKNERLTNKKKWRAHRKKHGSDDKYMDFGDTTMATPRMKEESSEEEMYEAEIHKVVKWRATRSDIRPWWTLALVATFMTAFGLMYWALLPQMEMDTHECNALNLCPTTHECLRGFCVQKSLWRMDLDFDSTQLTWGGGAIKAKVTVDGTVIDDATISLSGFQELQESKKDYQVNFHSAIPDGFSRCVLLRAEYTDHSFLRSMLTHQLFLRLSQVASPLMKFVVVKSSFMSTTAAVEALYTMSQCNDEEWLASYDLDSAAPTYRAAPTPTTIANAEVSGQYCSYVDNAPTSGEFSLQNVMVPAAGTAKPSGTADPDFGSLVTGCLASEYSRLKNLLPLEGWYSVDLFPSATMPAGGSGSLKLTLTSNRIMFNVRMLCSPLSSFPGTFGEEVGLDGYSYLGDGNTSFLEQSVSADAGASGAHKAECQVTWTSESDGGTSFAKVLEVYVLIGGAAAPEMLTYPTLSWSAGLLKAHESFRTSCLREKFDVSSFTDYMVVRTLVANTNDYAQYHMISKATGKWSVYPETHALSFGCKWVSLALGVQCLPGNSDLPYNSGMFLQLKYEWDRWQCVNSHNHLFGVLLADGEVTSCHKSKVCSTLESDIWTSDLPFLMDHYQAMLENAVQVDDLAQTSASTWDLELTRIHDFIKNRKDHLKAELKCNEPSSEQCKLLGDKDNGLGAYAVSAIVVGSLAIVSHFAVWYFPNERVAQGLVVVWAVTMWVVMIEVFVMLGSVRYSGHADVSMINAVNAGPASPSYIFRQYLSKRVVERFLFLLSMLVVCIQVPLWTRMGFGAFRRWTEKRQIDWKTMSSAIELTVEPTDDDDQGSGDGAGDVENTTADTSVNDAPATTNDDGEDGANATVDETAAAAADTENTTAAGATEGTDGAKGVTFDDIALKPMASGPTVVDTKNGKLTFEEEVVEDEKSARRVRRNSEVSRMKSELIATKATQIWTTRLSLVIGALLTIGAIAYISIVFGNGDESLEADFTWPSVFVMFICFFAMLLVRTFWAAMKWYRMFRLGVHVRDMDRVFSRQALEPWDRVSILEKYDARSLYISDEYHKRMVFMCDGIVMFVGAILAAGALPAFRLSAAFAFAGLLIMAQLLVLVATLRFGGVAGWLVWSTSVRLVDGAVAREAELYLWLVDKVTLPLLIPFAVWMRTYFQGSETFLAAATLFVPMIIGDAVSQIISVKKSQADNTDDQEVTSKWRAIPGSIGAIVSVFVLILLCYVPMQAEFDWYILAPCTTALATVLNMYVPPKFGKIGCTIVNGIVLGVFGVASGR